MNGFVRVSEDCLHKSGAVFSECSSGNPLQLRTDLHNVVLNCWTFRDQGAFCNSGNGLININNLV